MLISRRIGLGLPGGCRWPAYGVEAIRNVKRSRFNIAIRVAAAVIAAACLQGCGDPIQRRVQSARSALEEHRPSEALKFAQEVLDSMPKDFDAGQIKASALLRLKRFEECQAAIDKLDLFHPDQVAVHQLWIDWGLARVEALLKEVSLGKDVGLQKQFGQAWLRAETSAKWLSGRGDPREAQLVLARLSYFDALRLEAMLKPLKPKPGASFKQAESWGRQEEAIQRLEQGIQGRLAEAEQNLGPLLSQGDVLTQQAYEVYAQVLISGQRDDEFFTAAERVAGLGELSDTLVSLYVTRLLELPDRVRPLELRLELAWKLQDATRQDRRATLQSTLTRVQLHQAAGEWDRAALLLSSAQKVHADDPQVRLLLAKNFYGQGDYGQAMTQLLRLDIDNPGMARVKALQGLVQIKMDRANMARLALRDALELDPGDETARSAFLELLTVQGYSDTAQQDLDLYLHHYPDDARALRVALRRGVTTSSPELVEKVLEWTQRLPVLGPEQLALLVDGYNYLKRFDESEKYARQWSQLQPDSLEAQLRLAEVLLRRVQGDEAAKVLMSFRQIHPEAPSLDILWAQAYLSWNPAPAARHLEQAAHDQPTDLGVRALLAEALARASRADAAAEQIQLVLDEEPNRLAAHAQAWRVFQLIGWEDLANYHLRQIRPDQVSSQIWPALLARIEMQNGEFEKSREICTTALLRGDTDPLLQLTLIEVLKADGLSRQEETHLKAYLNTTTDYPRGFQMLCQHYLDQANPQRGLKEIAGLAPLNPGLAAVASARLLRSMRRDDEALAKLRQAYDDLLQGGDSSVLHVADALVTYYVEHDDRAAARQVYEGLIAAGLEAGPARIRHAELAPTPEDRSRELGRLADELPPTQTAMARPIALALVQAGQPEKAVDFVERLIGASDHPLPLLRLKSQLQAQSGGLQVAAQTLERAIGLAPHSADLRFRLGDLLAQGHDFPGALREYETAGGVGPSENIQAGVKIAHLMQSIGLEEVARDQITQVQSAYLGQDPEVLLTLGQTLARAGKHDKAIEYLLKVPPVAQQYPPAQVLVSHIQLQQGRAEDARDRATEVARQAGYMNAVAEVILSNSQADRRYRTIAQWVDKIIDENVLSEPLKMAWLQQRLQLEADNSDWMVVLRTLKKIQNIDPSRSDCAAGMVAVLLYQQRGSAAVDAYRACPPLASSEVGPLLANLVGLNTAELPPAQEQATSFGAYLDLVLRGRIAEARSVARQLPSRGTLFRTDCVVAFDGLDARSPDLAAALRQLGIAYAALYAGVPQLTIEVCHNVAAAFPNLVLIYSLDAQASRLLDQPLGKMYNTVERTCPQSDLFFYLAAQDRADSGNFLEACQSLQQLLAKDAPNDEILITLARYQAEAGQIDEAIQTLQLVSRGTGPHRFEATVVLAQMMLRHRPDRLVEIADQIDAAIRRSPDDPICLNALGWIRYLQGRDAEALPLLQNALPTMREFPEIHCQLGIVYHRLGLIDPWARYHLQQAAMPRAVEYPSVLLARDLLDKLPKRPPETPETPELPLE